MFVTLRNKLSDIGTLSALCKEAEQVPRADGNETPGSEHFILTSLSLQDGTARRALRVLGITPQQLAQAASREIALHEQDET